MSMASPPSAATVGVWKMNPNGRFQLRYVKVDPASQCVSYAERLNDKPSAWTPLLFSSISDFGAGTGKSDAEANENKTKVDAFSGKEKQMKGKVPYPFYLRSRDRVYIFVADTAAQRELFLSSLRPHVKLVDVSVGMMVPTDPVRGGSHGGSFETRDSNASTAGRPTSPTNSDTTTASVVDDDIGEFTRASSPSVVDVSIAFGAKKPQEEVVVPAPPSIGGVQFNRLAYPPVGLLNRDVLKPSLIGSGDSLGDSQEPGEVKDISTIEAQNALFKLYANIFQLKSKYPEIAIPMPRFILIGSQSAGKSTITELLAGFPINVCKNEVGTRRPLAVVLEYDPSVPIGNAICTVDGREVAQDLVSQEVEKLNALLSPKTKNPNDEGSFSNDYINLRIRAADVNNMVFVDPPGLRVDGSGAQMTIEKVLTNELQNPDNMVVAVLNTGDFGNQKAIAFLNHTKGEEWVQRPGNVIFLMPRFDTITKECDHGQSANERMESMTRPWMKPFHLITRAYDVGPNPSFNDKRAHLKAIPVSEKEKIAEWVQKMKSRESTDPASRFDLTRFEHRIGWDKALAIFQRALGLSIKATLPGNLGLLKALLDETSEKTRALEKIVAQSNKHKLRSFLVSFVVDLCKEIRSCIDGDVKAANLLSVTKIGQTAAEEADAFKSEFTLKTARVPWIDEKSEKEFAQCVEAQEQQLRTFHTPEEDRHLNANVHLYGGKQYQRTKFYFWRALDKAVDSTLTIEMILDAQGILNSNVMTGDTTGAVARCTAFCMARSILPGIPYLLKRLSYVLMRCFNIASHVMRKDPEWRSVCARFVKVNFMEKLKTCCENFLKERIQFIANHCKQIADASYLSLSAELQEFDFLSNLIAYAKKQASTTLPDQKREVEGGPFGTLGSHMNPQLQGIVQLVREQVLTLMCLSKVNLNNSMNSLLLLDFKDHLEAQLLDVVSRMTDDEIMDLFGVGGPGVKGELDKLKSKESEIRGIIAEYSTIQAYVNAL